MGQQRKLKIFIGCSLKYVVQGEDGNIDIKRTEKEGRIKPVLQAIKKCGYEPVPWYKNQAINSKERILLKGLISASKKYDGGVFILGEDVITRKKNYFHPNDNVLIELGMFYASKGITKTFCILDKETKENEISIPSDLKGILYSNIKNKNYLADQLKSFFNEPVREKRYDKVTFYLDPKCLEKKLTKEYKDWKTKGLYVGTESSLIWDNIESDSLYDANIEFISRFFEDAISSLDYDNLHNVISFGPGNGKTDKALLEKFKIYNEDIKYIPVDLNQYMAFQASLKMGEINTRVPFAIIDDFETNVDHLKNILKGKTHEIGENNFYSMLGVTFSNLEENEDALFIKINSLMNDKDYFLLDAVIKKESKKSEKENLITLLFEENSSIKGYRDLFINSALKKFLIYKKMASAEQISELKANISKYINLDEIEGVEKDTYTKVKNTSVFKCTLNYEGFKNTLLILKRYNFNDLFTTLDRHFHVIKSDNNNKDNTNNRGLFLLRKKLK